MSEDESKLELFEEQLAELEALVRNLEAGESRLEDAVRNFERGVELSRNCENLLKQAELRVMQLSTDANGDERLQDAPDLEKEARS